MCLNVPLTSPADISFRTIKKYISLMSLPNIFGTIIQTATFMILLVIYFSFFRHNLTLNKAFIKVPRPATEGRGAYWKLEAGAESQIFRRMARNYNRPKTITFTPRHNIFYCDNSDVKTVYITVPT